MTVAAELAADELSVSLRDGMATTVSRFAECMNAYNTSEALAALNTQVGLCNAFIEKTQPFMLAKDETRLAELQSVLAHLLECCVQVGYLIGCVLPEASARILSQLQVDAATLRPQSLVWGVLENGHSVQAPSPVFPRILSEEEKQKMAERAAKAAAKAARKAAAK